MSQSALQFRFCHRPLDEQATVDFLDTQKDALYLPDKTAVSQVVDLVFNKGGVFAGFDKQRQMQAVLGFFFGEPKQGYRNKEILYMYVAAMAETYRLTRAFHVGLTQVLREFQQMGLQEIRLQAAEGDRYTNKLYGRFAQPIGSEKSLRGKVAITYGGTIADALTYLERGKRAQIRHTPTYSDRNTAQHAAALLP